MMRKLLLPSNTLDMFLHRPGPLAASATPDPCQCGRHEGGTLKEGMLSQFSPSRRSRQQWIGTCFPW